MCIKDDEKLCKFCHRRGKLIAFKMEIKKIIFIISIKFIAFHALGEIGYKGSVMKNVLREVYLRQEIYKCGDDPLAVRKP